MDVKLLGQPPIQVGAVIDDLLRLDRQPREVVMVSAFASRQTLLRFRERIGALKQAGCQVRIIVGIDLDGTSKEALQELIHWDVDTRIVKNRRPGHTFHPKLYVVETDSVADILIGSNNLTDGGFYRNYEVAVQTSFSLPADSANYATHRADLAQLTDPSGDDVRALDDALLVLLERAGLVKTEQKIRKQRRKSGAADQSGSAPRATSPFGVRSMPSPPPLPPSVLHETVRKVQRDRVKRVRSKPGVKKVVVQSPDELSPTYFYMELNRLQGPRIPGEARIPMAARNLAEDFWGWPEMYRSESRSGGIKTRRYWNWKPKWRISDSANPTSITSENVRMYEYEASQDFRFYSPALVHLGADEGDIVQIARLSENNAEFECILAKKATATYAAWRPFCTEAVNNSQRHYGYT